MSPEELKTETEQHSGPAPGSPQRPRRRRSGRGHRGRGRRSPTPGNQGQARPSDTVVEPGHEVVMPRADVEESQSGGVQRQEPESGGSLNAVQKAIEEVNEIIQNLREALDEMDSVLETLELAERQKNADEREVESLRRALRQVHRPREGGSQLPKGHS